MFFIKRIFRSKKKKKAKFQFIYILKNHRVLYNIKSTPSLMKSIKVGLILKCSNSKTLENYQGGK